MTCLKCDHALTTHGRGDCRCRQRQDDGTWNEGVGVEPAFPLHNGDAWGGMSLRDFFAAQALGAMTERMGWKDLDPEFVPDPAGEIARDAYAVADAMLAARAK